MPEAWIPYDHEHEDANPLPEAGQFVWIYDAFYQGVTVGTWEGNFRNGWWLDATGNDDIGVEFWMPMDCPAAPAEAGDL